MRIYIDASVILNGPIAATIAPPALGEKCLRYLCTPAELEGAFGDIEERFKKIAVNDGGKAARRWYWRQVMRSCAAFGMRLVTAVASLGELLSKFGL